MITTIKKIFENYIKTIGKGKSFFILFFGIMVAGVTVLEPIIFSKIIEQIELFLKTGEFNHKLIIYIIIFWAGYILVTLVLKYFYHYNLATKSNVLNFNEVTKKYSEKILFMKYSEYLGKQQGKIFKIFDRGTREQYLFLQFILVDLIKDLSRILIIIVILFFINVKMALLTLSMVPVMIGLGLYFLFKVTPKQRKLNDKWDGIFGKISNALGSFALTKILGIEKIFKKNIKNDLNNIFIKQLDINRSWSISEIYSGAIVMIARIIVLGFGIFFIIDGSLTFTELFLFFAYIGWIYSPLGLIFSKLENVTMQITAVEKMYDEFDNLEIDNLKNGKTIKNILGNIEFKNVNFGYSKNIKILKDLSFKINSGEKVAFVGSTGAGKSTIVNLIFRFWDIKLGEILLDGVNINKLSKESIRQNIGLVMQDSSLFNTTIKENLLFANKEANNKEIKKALKNAKAEFVFELKEGLDTIIGERGLKLSGGEKQRLSIARLFLKNPKILILDEATSALDNKTEILVVKALDNLIKGRTSIVIAHRLSTIKNADRIFMIENGRIIEEGNYIELINKKGKFFELSNSDNLIMI